MILPCAAGHDPHGQLATVLLELGHTACAKQDWPQAHRFYVEVLRTAGCTAAQAGLAEVARWEHDDAEASRLLAGVIDNPATTAATRCHAERLLSAASSPAGRQPMLAGQPTGLPRNGV